MLPLFSHRLIPEESDYLSFTLLLSRLAPGKLWQETEVTVKRHEHSARAQELTSPRRVRIKLPATQHGIRTLPTTRQRETRCEVTDLCQMIKRTTATRLNLNVDGISLFLSAESGRKMKGLEHANLVSLADGLLENETELNING